MCPNGCVQRIHGHHNARMIAGVVYRMKDTSLVLAVEDVPEEGMDQPLRIEKLANEAGVGWL